MHTDPSVVLCVLSRALRSLPLVSERSLPLLPTCTLIFYFFFEQSKSILVYFNMLLGFTRLYIIHR